ncbi:MAG TPA: fibronectin type III domain-containing protein, partial [Candidatus Udaeobacter sp.]|nr:fibronectin type III domain-containing protein [Candidatus Udaeobacter sp.]
GDDTYRMNGGIPDDEQDILLNAIIIGTHFGTQYQEIYEADLKDPLMSPVIDIANTLLTVTPPAPRAPTNLNGTSGGPWSANLTWRDNATNELGYRIELKIGASGTYALVSTLGPNTIATSITSLVEGTQYYYRVQGVNAGGVSAYSNEKSITTLLTSPGSLGTQALSSSQALLTWTDRSATEVGFKIERSAVTNRNYTEIATVDANATSFTDSGLSEATKYWYRVRAYNTDTTSAYSNEKQVTTLHNIPLPPSGLSITFLLPNQVSLAWSDNSANESGFKIQRKKGTTGTYSDIRTTAPNITSYNDGDTALLDGTLYYYRVCATNTAGDSAFSNETSGTTPLAKPTSATATAVSSSRIDLTWIDNSHTETGYKIERKKAPTGNYAQIDQVGANAQSYRDTNGLEPNTKYFYRIRTTNGSVDSDYSNTPSATTFR